MMTRRLIYLFCFCTCLINNLYGQNAKDTNVTPVVPASDSVSPFVRKVLDAGEKDKRKSEATYNAGRVGQRQKAVWGALISAAQDVKLYLVNGINLKSVAEEINFVKASFPVVQDGIFIKKGTSQTDRNLSVSSAILFQLIAKTEMSKKQVDNYSDVLTRYRSRIDSLLSDPVIYIFPTDSVELVKYLSRLRVIVSQGNPTDNALNATLDSVRILQNDIDSELFTLKTAYEKIEFYRDRLAAVNLSREFADIWYHPAHYRPFSEILLFSVAKERLAFAFYLQENFLKLFVLLCISILVYLFLISLKRKFKDGGQNREELDQKLILKRPVASSLIIVLSIFQFVFLNAPFIFSFFIWSIEVICLLVLLKNHITPFWFRFWIILSVLFLLSCMDNFILQASRSERWIMLGLACAGVVFGLFYLSSRRRQDLKERSILFFLRFLVLAEVLSLLFNLFGRYNLSKILLISGYTGIVNAILFLWVVRLINEGLALGSSLYRYPERRSFYINFNRLGSKAPLILYVLLAIGWGVLVGRQFYAFKRIAVPFGEFLRKERTLGDYSFSINGLVLFFLIAGCSMILSKIISFFAADPQAIHGHTAQSSKRASIGSWILIIRICIVSLGLFLAFAAVGLPLDKITIVLGALSVGIGLGLQGLVSNLVSGLIIAFEKPVNVGDQIEIGGKSGIMRSIGFRSSTVSLGDGSDLIVPNGDLLNDHVINWSASREAKKLVIPICIAYGSDLKQIKEILEEIAGLDERILKVPAAVAVPKGFGESAIDVDLVVWIKSQREALAVTGSVIMEIDKAFREKGIAIPFSRHDVHILKDKTTETETPDE